MGHRPHTEAAQVAGVPQHGHTDALLAAEVLDNGGHVEVTSVPHRDLPHLDQEVPHPQPTLTGRATGMEPADERPHRLSVLVTWDTRHEKTRQSILSFDCPTMKEGAEKVAERELRALL